MSVALFDQVAFPEEGIRSKYCFASCEANKKSLFCKNNRRFASAWFFGFKVRSNSLLLIISIFFPLTLKRKILQRGILS